MKKLLTAFMCAAVMFCTGITASAQPVDLPADIPENDTAIVYMEQAPQEAVTVLAEDDDGASAGTIILISVIIGIIIGVSVAVGLRSQLKSVRYQKEANSYFVQNTFDLTQKSDLYMYSRTEKTARPQNNK